MASGNAAELFLLGDGPLPVVASALIQREPCQGEQDRGLVPVGDAVSVAPVPDGLPDEVDPALEDLAEMSVVCSIPMKRKFENRSWEHAQHARMCRALKSTEARLTATEQKAATATERLALVAEIDSSVARALGTGRASTVFNEQKAVIVMRNSVLSVSGVTGAVALKSARCASILSRCL